MKQRTPKDIEAYVTADQAIEFLRKTEEYIRKTREEGKLLKITCRIHYFKQHVG